jgi:hypothetical protein
MEKNNMSDEAQDHMSDEAQDKAPDMITLQKMLGAPPVLISENPEDYLAIRRELVRHINPEDFLVLIYVDEIAIATWEIIRYRRHKLLACARWLQSQHARDEIREKLTTLREQKIAAASDGSPTVSSHLSNSQMIAATSLKELATLSKKNVSEYELAHAFEITVSYYERLDQLLSIAIRRRNQALEMIAILREGLGQRLREASTKITVGQLGVDNQEPVQDAPSVSPVVE